MRPRRPGAARRRGPRGRTTPCPTHRRPVPTRRTPSRTTSPSRGRTRCPATRPSRDAPTPAKRRRPSSPIPRSTPPPSPARLVQTCSEIGAGETMTEHLARLLSQFCASQAIRSGGECWEISLDLDPQILPETRLTLRLSSHTLSLRFEAGHPRSRHLLSEHGDTLRQRIHTLLRQQVDVELELW
ncbi:type III secretion system protein SctP [Ralstonia solanacearum]|uniref:type III secretion system protein SctP n=1 Tax=Ralstonia solanacearum TaxID=305 RepID=UPI0009BAF1E2|nr:type III secretion system protein SctP [Ralstonia solanacearum]